MGFFSKIWVNLKEWKKYSKYIILGLVVFILGLLFHFPLERFGSVITATVQRETGYIVQSEKLSFTLPIGVNAKKVVIQSPPGGPQPLMLQLDQLTLRPSVLALLTYPFRKAIGFSYSAKRGKENWSGSASFGPENTSLDVEADNFEWTGTFPLDQNPMFAGKTLVVRTVVNIDLSIKGKTIELQQGNLANAEGSLEISSKKTDIEAPMVNSLAFNKVDLDTDIKKGLLTIKKLEVVAPNISANANGDIKVEPFFPNSRIKLDLQVKADPSDTNISSLLQLVGSLYNVQATPDGTMALKINGPLNSPERMSITGF